MASQDIHPDEPFEREDPEDFD
jgi:hypothetical protein